MSGLLRTMFGYHAWANADLFGKLEELDPERHQADLAKALRLISHYHVVARIFAAHLTADKHGYTADNVEETPALADLRSAVGGSDQWYLDYVEHIRSDQLAERVAFVFTDGDKGYMSREEMLSHVILHGGYHRGEVGRILSQLSITPPWDTLAVYLHQTEPSRRMQGRHVSKTA
jgi:uncharacterized damage-inducible protein DinB